MSIREMLAEWKSLDDADIQSIVNSTMETSRYGEEDWLVSPLSVAAELGDLDFVQKLLELGALPDALVDGYRQKYTPLQMLLWQHESRDDELSVEIIKKLVEYGADVNYKDQSGYSWTPYYITQIGASHYGPNYKLGAELLKLGAAPREDSEEYGFGPSLRILFLNELKSFLSRPVEYLPPELHNDTITILKRAQLSFGENKCSIKVKWSVDGEDHIIAGPGAGALGRDVVDQANEFSDDLLQQAKNLTLSKFDVELIKFARAVSGLNTDAVNLDQCSLLREFWSFPNNTFLENLINLRSPDFYNHLKEFININFLTINSVCKSLNNTNSQEAFIKLIEGRDLVMSEIGSFLGSDDVILAGIAENEGNDVIL